MMLLRKVFYEFQYSKYVRQLPFYMVRHFGVRETYSEIQVDCTIKKYEFNQRFSPIAYAMFCNPELHDRLANKFKPCPDREELRMKIAKKYFNGDDNFSLYDLMVISTFKSQWSETGHSINDEYWRQMSKFKGKS